MTLLGFLCPREMVSALSPTLTKPWTSITARERIFCNGLPYGSLFPPVFCGMVFLWVFFLFISFLNFNFYCFSLLFKNSFTRLPKAAVNHILEKAMLNSPKQIKIGLE